MNSKMVNFFMFAAGAAIGSAVTWKVLKTKYERMVQEDIESVKEYYEKKYNKTEEDTDGKKEETETSEDDEPDGGFSEDEYEEYVQHANNYNGSEHLTLKEALERMKPYVISYEEYGGIGYDTVVLYYYNDGVLVTEYDDVIGNIEDVVGLDALNDFGEYGEDRVFVRNDRLKTDYEILMSLQNYTETDDGEITYS